MDSYNLTNGVHLTQNAYLNTEVAKKEWGFTGVMMSDWFATYDGVAAANGGLDLEMPSGAFMNRKTLMPAIQQGKVSVATIDDKVRRILRTAIQFGWLDRDQTDVSVPRYNQQGRQAALQAAMEGMVLLKNEGHLLAREGAEVAQVYVADHHAKVPRPAKELKGFSKINLRPGEIRRVTVSLDSRALSYYDVDGKQWVAEPGDFDVLVGRSSAQIELRGKVNLTAPIRTK
jgi:beta-glucosidase